MSLNASVLLLLIAHFLGDFQLQTKELAEKKVQNPGALALHLLIHAGLLAGVNGVVYGLVGYDPAMIQSSCFILITHAIIDFIKYLVNRHTEIRKDLVYCADQFLHLLMIFLASQYFGGFRIDQAHLDLSILRWILLVVLITKPANITFKLLFSKYSTQQSFIQPATQRVAIVSVSALTVKAIPLRQRKQSNEQSATVLGAGALIGTLERLLTALLLLAGQYTLIGIVLTAKSVARFDRISKDQAFAEYYLLGSLFSLLWVVSCYMLFFNSF